MTDVAASVFAISTLYAGLADSVVYALLVRRGAKPRILWAGTPGYLYRVCARSGPLVGAGLRRLALSAGVASLAAIASGIWFVAVSYG